MSLSKLHKKCEECEYKNNCDEKRMVECGLLELPENIQAESSIKAGASISMPTARTHTPIKIDMGEYGGIDTSLEEIKKQIKKDMWKQISGNCFKI